MTLPDEEGPIDVEIAELLTSVLPPSWRSAMLEIEVVPQPEGVKGLTHKIRGPRGIRELVSPPDEMYEASFRLYDLFLREGQPWRRVQYLVTQTPQGDWKYQVAFEYA